ncbi:MAG: sodium/solute symporter [Acidobacteriota bacterium]
MTGIDYMVLALYMGVALAIGAYFGRGQKTGLTYFLGDRSIHWLPAGITMTAVSVSTVTFIGMPGQSFKSDWTFLQVYMILPLACWLITRVFLPFYSRLKVVTAYEFLEHRFDVRTRLLASGLFQVIICGSTGVVIYAPAIMLSEMAGTSVSASILVVGVVTTLYTMFGGVRGVIYTDILQAGVFMTGWLSVVVFVLSSVPGGWTELWSVAMAEGKLRTFDFSLDPAVPATIWSGVFAMLFVHLALNGVNQTQVQKYLAVSTQAGGRLAILFHGFSLLGVYVAFFSLGTLLYVFYRSKLGSLPADIHPDRVFPYFIMTELPSGLRGFLIAGAFSAAMSTISSALNSLANVTVVDFWDRFRPGATVRRAKVLTVVWGAVVIGAGLLAVRLGSILELIVKVNSYFYGCILGVFLLGMTTRRVGGQAAFAGLLSSLLTILALAVLQPDLWIWFGAIGCLTAMAVGYSASRLGLDREKQKALRAAALFRDGLP